MADKELRRRRKRKEVSRKDETAHLDLQTSPSQYSMMQSKDSDQDIEDDSNAIIPVHQASKVAQVVFMCFFFILVAIMCFVFVALQGNQRLKQTEGFNDEITDAEVRVVDDISEILIEVPKVDEQETIQIENSFDSEDKLTDLKPFETFPITDREADDLSQNFAHESYNTDVFSDVYDNVENNVNADPLNTGLDEANSNIDTEKEFTNGTIDSNIEGIEASKQSTDASPVIKLVNDIEETIDEEATFSSTESIFDSIENQEFDESQEDKVQLDSFTLRNSEKVEVTDGLDFEEKEHIEDILNILEEDDTDDDENEDEFEFWQF